MAQFLKFLFASCLGVFLALTLMVLVLVGIGASMASGLDSKPEVKKNTVLTLSFDKPIPELTNNVEVESFSFDNNNKTLGLYDIVHAIEAAKEDDNIKGILMEADMVGLSPATASVLRDAILDFKKSKKFVIAHANVYSQTAYYLASAADKVYLNPEGIIDFRGYAAQVPFFKDGLDKLGVKMEVFYAGKFKSATEPYRRNEMSDEYRLQMREYLDESYTLFLNDIAKSRNVSTEELRKAADEFVGFEDDLSKQYKLVDDLKYIDQVYDELRGKIGLEKEDKIPVSTIENYYAYNPKDLNISEKQKIAVVYAEGTIVGGEADPGSIGDENYGKILRKLRYDDAVKAVVIRVNSPGGSAQASENIWREIKQLQKAGKKVVVSMGDYAASGGYYIAAAADSIFAEPNTLTGSIGVFSAFPNMNVLLNEKLGIHLDTVKTGQLSAALNTFHPLSEKEQILMQRHVDQMYQGFLKRVSDGRGMSIEEVNEIAQGRVWTGQRAKTLGLVDGLGGLDRAIASAAKLSGTKKYRLVEYPKTKDPIQQMIEKFLNKETDPVEATLKSQFGSFYPIYRFMQDTRYENGVQARLPFMMTY